MLVSEDQLEHHNVISVQIRGSSGPSRCPSNCCCAPKSTWRPARSRSARSAEHVPWIRACCATTTRNCSICARWAPSSRSSSPRSPRGWAWRDRSQRPLCRAPAGGRRFLAARVQLKLDAEFRASPSACSKSSIQLPRTHAVDAGGTVPAGPERSQSRPRHQHSRAAPCAACSARAMSRPANSVPRRTRRCGPSRSSAPGISPSRRICRSRLASGQKVKGGVRLRLRATAASTSTSSSCRACACSCRRRRGRLQAARAHLWRLPRHAGGSPQRPLPWYEFIRASTFGPSASATIRPCCR